MQELKLYTLTVVHCICCCLSSVKTITRVEEIKEKRQSQFIKNRYMISTAMNFDKWDYGQVLSCEIIF